MFIKLYADMRQLRQNLSELFPNGYVRYIEHENGATISVTNFQDYPLRIDSLFFAAHE